MDTIIYFLLLLQLKHWYIDFVNQSPQEISSKGIYGDVPGVWHSGKHGIGTMLCAFLILDADLYNWIFAAILGIIDFTAHYHIDWFKSNFGQKDINKKSFWVWLGLDQTLHQLTYLLLALMTI